MSFGMLALSGALLLGTWVGFIVWRTQKSAVSVVFGVLFQQFCFGTSFLLWIIGFTAQYPLANGWVIFLTWLGVGVLSVAIVIWTGLLKTLPKEM